MNGIVAAIYASLFLALSQIALKKSYKDLAPSVSFFFDAVFGILIWIPVSLLLGAKISDLPITLIYAVISALLSEAFYFYALSKGQLSITGIIVASYPIYTILFSFFINGERLSPLQLTFIMLTITGTLMSYLPSKLNKKELIKSQVLLWPFIAAIAVGFSDALSKNVINKTSPFSFVLALAIVQLPIALIYLKFEKQHVVQVLKDARDDIQSYKLCLFGSFFNIVGTGLLWYSFTYTLASIASPITATSGAILVILTLLFTNEKIALKNLLGIILVFGGIFGLSFFL